MIEYAEEFRIIEVCTPVSWRWRVNPHSLPVTCARWLPSKEYGMHNFIAEKSDKTLPRQRLSRSTSVWLNHINSLYPWCDETGPSPRGPSCPKPITPVYPWEIPSEKPKWKGILQNTWPILPQSVKVIKNKKCLGTCHRPEGPKETWWLNVTWYPRCGPGTEKRTSGRKLKISQ